MKLVQQQQQQKAAAAVAGNQQAGAGGSNLLKPTPSPLPPPSVSLQLPGAANSPRCPSPMLQPPASPRAVAPSPISKSFPSSYILHINHINEGSASVCLSKVEDPHKYIAKYYESHFPPDITMT
jgi:hypothetical protein